MPLFRNLSEYAFLTKEGVDTHFKGKVHNLRPYVKVRLAGIPVYTIPYEHLISFEYKCDGVDWVKLTFYDQTSIFIEQLIRLSQTEQDHTPIEVEYGWWSPEIGTFPRAPRTLKVELMKVTYNFGTLGPYVNIEGPAFIFKHFSSNRLKLNTFRPQGLLGSVSSKDSKAAEEKGFEKLSSAAQTRVFNVALSEFVRRNIGLDDGPREGSVKAKPVGVEVMANINQNAMTQLLGEEIVFSGEETLLEAVEKIADEIITQDNGVVKVFVSAAPREGVDSSGEPVVYLNTIYIIDTSFLLKEAERSNISGDARIPILYPAPESSVINFTPTYDAWITWIKGAVRIAPDQSGNPDGEVKEGPKVNNYYGQNNPAARAFKLTSSETSAEVRRFGANQELKTATASLQFMGEPELMGAGNLFATIFDITINVPQMGTLMAQDLYYQNFPQLRDDPDAISRLGGESVGIPNSRSPFTGSYALSGFTHSIGAGSAGFSTTLELIKVG